MRAKGNSRLHGGCLYHWYPNLMLGFLLSSRRKSSGSCASLGAASRLFRNFLPSRRGRREISKKTRQRGTFPVVNEAGVHSHLYTGEPCAYRLILSISASSSAVKLVFSAALMLSSTCSGRDAPARTLVTMPSRRIQLSAIWARVCPRCAARSLS